MCVDECVWLCVVVCARARVVRKGVVTFGTSPMNSKYVCVCVCVFVGERETKRERDREKERERERGRG